MKIHPYTAAKMARIAAELEGKTRYVGRPCYKDGNPIRTVHKNRCVVCKRAETAAARAKKKRGEQHV